MAAFICRSGVSGAAAGPGPGPQRRPWWVGLVAAKRPSSPPGPCPRRPGPRGRRVPDGRQWGGGLRPPLSPVLVCCPCCPAKDPAALVPTLAAGRVRRPPTPPPAGGARRRPAAPSPRDLRGRCPAGCVCGLPDGHAGPGRRLAVGSVAAGAPVPGAPSLGAAARERRAHRRTAGAGLPGTTAS